MSVADHPGAGGGAAPSKRRWHDLGARTVSAVVLIVVAIASTGAGGVWFELVWFAAALAVQWEWQRLVAGPRLSGRMLAGIAVTCALALAPPGWRGDILVVTAGAALAAALAGPRRRLWAAAGIAYGGLFLWALLGLRGSVPFGARSIFWLFATVWSVDVFAYLGGRLIGGPKLWPRVSPSKTWSGTLCGVAAGGLIGTLVALQGLQPPADAAPIFALTLATAVVSQIGDGYESAMKRFFDVKDSGRLIPGHGGVMDRLDGFIAASVFAFLFGLARSMPPAIGLFYWS